MHRLRIYIAIALVLFTSCVGLSRIVSDEPGVSPTASVSSFLDGSLDINETHQIHQLKVLFYPQIRWETSNSKVIRICGLPKFQMMGKGLILDRSKSA
jgi:hypothetical protein